MPAFPVLWRDRRGRLSALRIATLAVLIWPALLIVIDAGRGALGGRPLNEAIHRTGWWALVFLLLSLAVTPLRRSARFGRLVDIRRMVGVAAAIYAGIHILLYVADLRFDLLKVGSEIVSRLYLTIGFAALLGLLVLAATSNDASVKRLGGLRWRRLHLAAYGITLLALIHFFQQTKADITVPTLYAGLFAWLMGYRLLAGWRGEGALSPLGLVGLAVAAGLVTLLGEAVGIAIAFSRPVLAFAGQFLVAAFDPDLGIRPGWWVLAAGLAMAALEAVRGWGEGRAAPAPAGSTKVAVGSSPGSALQPR
ncbi:ferric reductase-like transmembrane domain-containing protein [Enterovirga sp.]|uniref:sulfite oxidase heme-binding subunit YedZ n=1 Tax=Enterovirga sp. TaxID=2026350 RepID=UPI0026183689|nr:ferric reductase-like transmembrane domain-containing protein [Enterovirga sp.]MDB5590452.1 ferric reductase protein [Enterovirga sp.]